MFFINPFRRPFVHSETVILLSKILVERCVK